MSTEKLHGHTITKCQVGPGWNIAGPDGTILRPLHHETREVARDWVRYLIDQKGRRSILLGTHTLTHDEHALCESCEGSVQVGETCATTETGLVCPRCLPI